MRRLCAAVAIAALTVSTAYAKPGGGGGGEGQGHGNAGAKALGADAMAFAGSDKAKANDHGSGDGGHVRADRRPQSEREPGVDRQAGRDTESSAKTHGSQWARDDRQPRGAQGDAHERDAQRIFRDAAAGRGNALPERVVWTEFDRRGAIQGCPPGLAKKNNGCVPPGHPRQNAERRYDRNWWGLRSLTSVNDYRYYDGNMVRYGSDGRIAGYYPLLGGSLLAGNVWPDFYPATPLPDYYRTYYGLGADYRYADGAIYRVNPQTLAIQSLAALLTGDRFSVGQALPPGYGVYNVPYQYRDRYADGPDANYRYSDGYVYQVDPTSRLIVAAIRLLT